MKKFFFKLLKNFFSLLSHILAYLFKLLRNFIIFVINNPVSKKVFKFINRILLKLFNLLVDTIILIADVIVFIWRIVGYILNKITYPLFLLVFVILFVISCIWSSLWFFFLFFVRYPYNYLNKHYNIKIRTILFLKFIWRWYVENIYVHLKYLYLTVFYINLVEFYVAYLWRPRNFFLKLTIGWVLRVLEEIIDLFLDTVIAVFDIICVPFYKILRFYHARRRKIVLKLRPVNKGKYYMRFIATRYWLKTFVFFFLTWYFTYFLLINSAEIGPWWGKWSIPSFCLFFNVFYYHFFYYALRHWKYLYAYFKDNLMLFWCVVGCGWVDAQYMSPSSWGVPPGKWLPMILSFWF